MQRSGWVLLGLLGTLVVLLVVRAGREREPRAACVSTSMELSAQMQRLCGQALYSERCASCHEADADELTPLTPPVLASYHSAANVFDYVVMSMPEDDPGSMSDEDYWAVVAHLLASRQLVQEDVVLAPETADELILR